MRIDVYTWQDAYVSTIGPEELLSLTHTDALNGEDSVDIVTTFALKQGYRLVWVDRLGKVHEHVCQDPKGLHAGGDTVYTDTAINSICETYGDYIEDKRPYGHSYEEILNRILAWMEENGVPAYNEETGKGLVRHVLIRFGFMTKEIMVCLVVNGKKLPAEEKLIKSLTELEGMTSITLSANRERTNVIMGKEIRCLWGQGYITDYIGTVKYRISPLSFYQVNPAQTEKLYGLALEYAGLTGNETVWDLYCGDRKSVV